MKAKNLEKMFDQGKEVRLILTSRRYAGQGMSKDG